MLVHLGIQFDLFLLANISDQPAKANPSVVSPTPGTGPTTPTPTPFRKLFPFILLLVLYIIPKKIVNKHLSYDVLIHIGNYII